MGIENALSMPSEYETKPKFAVTAIGKFSPPKE